MLNFNVKNQTISRTDDFNVVADSQNYLTAEFAFSEEWSTPATAVFGYDGTFYSVLLEDNSCTVPWEVIKAPFFSVSVFCGNRITANVVEVYVGRSGYVEGETPKEPTPDVYSRLIALSEEAARIAQSIRNDADNGMFDGQQGPKGEQGTQGEPGLGGLILETIPDVSSGDITVEPFNMTVIGPLTGATTITLGKAIAGYDNEWDFQITQGEAAQQLTLPAIKWGLGIAPTFAANTITVCRLYYLGNALHGEWACNEI